MKFAAAQIWNHRIVDSPQWEKLLRTLKDGWYRIIVDKPTEALEPILRDAFFAAIVRCWQDKINESGMFRMWDPETDEYKIVYADNYITYQHLKKEYGEKDPETGEPWSISNAGPYDNELFKKFMRVCEEGYYHKFGEPMPL